MNLNSSFNGKNRGSGKGAGKRSIPELKTKTIFS